MTDIPHNPTHCRSCGAEIVWLRTKAGRLIPVNAATALETDTEFDHNRHVSHFATCPQANKWRKPK
jgi:hypothetical protein